MEGKSYEDGGVVRPNPASYHPTVWGDYFVTHQFQPSEKSEAWAKKRMEELVKEVKILLVSYSNNHLQQMQLIDALQRLGVSYHFEKEINEALSNIHSAAPVDINDLHFVALWFRLLRQHGYNISSDIFSNFKDSEGHFKATLSNNVEGLLSLYEAAYLSTPQDDILDDAIDFTKCHLIKFMKSCSESPLSIRVFDALQIPLWKRMPRLEAKNYIAVYEQDKEYRNDMVLKLAKLDFHLLQLLHREEVKSLTMWSNRLGLTKKLTFARDRLVECYFWILGVYFEPHYARARMIMTKMIYLFSFMDDIYDDYGTMEELELFTEVIQRWDLERVNQLNENLKFQFIALYDTVNNIEHELSMQQLSYRVQYLKDTVKETSLAWLQEAKWRDEKYVPPLEEYLSVSLVFACYHTLACTSFIGMGEDATKEAFDWIIKFPKMARAMATICRLKDDVASQEFEQKREHVASGVQCYMKEHGVTLQEACKKLLEMVEKGWKELNQEWLINQSSFSMHLLGRILNLARIIEIVYYKDVDGYTDSSTTMEDNITQLLVEPMHLEEGF